MKSAEIYPNGEVMNVTGVDVTLHWAEASVLEVGYVDDRSEVYKISMARMYVTKHTDEILNVRV